MGVGTGSWLSSCIHTQEVEDEQEVGLAMNLKAHPY